jgi:ElaB/YqjD/DUF883 family membrane-anchored ribosome-binding protein
LLPKALVSGFVNTAKFTAARNFPKRLFAFLQLSFNAVKNKLHRREEKAGCGMDSMELYYKDLISEEASLEKLVDELVLLVQGANEVAEAAGATLAGQPIEELTTRLQRLKESCRRLKVQAVSGAQATDKLLRKYPYSAIGFAFAVGVGAGVLFRRIR